jgi:mannan endo-1,4-beta-mannosidase
MNVIKIDGRAVTNHWMLLQNTNGKIFERTDILPSYPSPNWYFNGGLDFPDTQLIPTFELPDGDYQINPQGGNNFIFQVYGGQIQYDADCDIFLEGRGTDTLVLKGYEITIDARYLIGNGLTFWGVLGFGPNDPKGKADKLLIHKKVCLLPGSNYYFVVASGMYGDFYFTVEKNGKITLDAKYASFMSIEANHTLVIKGFPILIDGRLNGSEPQEIFGIYQIYDTPLADNHTNWSYAKVVMGNFVPTWESHGYFPFNAPGGTSGVSKEGFLITADGTIVVSHPQALKVDTFNGIRRITILKTLTDRLSEAEPEITEADHLMVSGSFVTDVCGNNIIIRGINVAAHNWGFEPLTTQTNITDIKSTGANAIRIPWYVAHPDPRTQAYRLENLDALISLCAQNGIVPILEIHDLTTSNDYNNFNNTILSWWLQPDTLNLIKKHEKYLIANIANEFGHYAWAGSTPLALNAFQAAYLHAIAQLRSTGIRVPLMIDAPDGGSSVDALLQIGNNLLQNDPLHNLIFSVHTYWAVHKYHFNNNARIIGTKAGYLNQVESFINAMKNSGLCFVLGEVANQQDGWDGVLGQPLMCEYDITDIYQTVLRTAESVQIGWLAWLWHHDTCVNRQVSLDNTALNLSVFGDDIINNPNYGLKATAKAVPFICN